jgi:hypothetical protein
MHNKYTQKKNTTLNIEEEISTCLVKLQTNGNSNKQRKAKRGFSFGPRFHCETSRNFTANNTTKHNKTNTTTQHNNKHNNTTQQQTQHNRTQHSKQSICLLLFLEESHSTANWNICNQNMWGLDMLIQTNSMHIFF